jgi:hypothetical protein
MLLEAAVVLCLTNATDTAVSGLVRDGRFKTHLGQAVGDQPELSRTPGRDAVPRRWRPARPAAPTIDGVALAKPQLVVWSGQSPPRSATRRGTTATPSAARPARPRPASA